MLPIESCIPPWICDCLLGSSCHIPYEILAISEECPPPRPFFAFLCAPLRLTHRLKKLREKLFCDAGCSGLNKSQVTYTGLVSQLRVIQTKQMENRCQPIMVLDNTLDSIV